MNMQDARTKEIHGLAWGLVGVTVFAMTLPMTRLATGTMQAPLLSGAFIAFGRAVVAALLSAAFLLITRAPWPNAKDLPALLVTSACVVFGFPLCSSIAMRQVPAVHASVILGVLPLATAAVGAFLHKQRPAPAFWLCAALGSGLVVGFSLLRSQQGGIACLTTCALNR